MTLLAFTPFLFPLRFSRLFVFSRLYKRPYKPWIVCVRGPLPGQVAVFPLYLFFSTASPPPTSVPPNRPAAWRLPFPFDFPIPMNDSFLRKNPPRSRKQDFLPLRVPLPSRFPRRLTNPWPGSDGDAPTNLTRLSIVPFPVLFDGLLLFLSDGLLWERDDLAHPLASRETAPACGPSRPAALSGLLVVLGPRHGRGPLAVLRLAFLPSLQAITTFSTISEAFSLLALPQPGISSFVQHLLLPLCVCFSDIFTPNDLMLSVFWGSAFKEVPQPPFESPFDWPCMIGPTPLVELCLMGTDFREQSTPPSPDKFPLWAAGFFPGHSWGLSEFLCLFFVRLPLPILPSPAIRTRNAFMPKRASPVLFWHRPRPTSRLSKGSRRRLNLCLGSYEVFFSALLFCASFESRSPRVGAADLLRAFDR